LPWRWLIPASLKKTLPNRDQFCLESAFDAGLLVIMFSITGDGSANYMKLCLLDSKSQPKLVIHTVEKRRIDVSAGSVPQLSREKYLRLIEKLSGIPARVKIQEIIERQRTIAARRHVLVDKLAVAINFCDAGLLSQVRISPLAIAIPLLIA